MSSPRSNRHHCLRPGGAHAFLDTLTCPPENAAMPEFCLSLGSSVGAREGNLIAAIQGLEAAGLCLARVSSIYETEPVGEAAGPGWFLNIAACGKTDLAPRRILEIAGGIERDL